MSEEIDQPRLAMDSYSNRVINRAFDPDCRDSGSKSGSCESKSHLGQAHAGRDFSSVCTATAGLRVVYLITCPTGNASAGIAAGWLRTGGQLHLLQTRTQIAQSLKVFSSLNDPRTVFSVGSGTVIQHDFQRDGLSEELVAQHVRPPVLTEAPEEIQANSAYRRRSVVDGISIDSEILLGLRELTHLKHNWFLIFLLSILLHRADLSRSWLISRVRTIHYLATYGAIIAAAVVFSGCFSSLDSGDMENRRYSTA